MMVLVQVVVNPHLIGCVLVPFSFANQNLLVDMEGLTGRVEALTSDLLAYLSMFCKVALSMVEPKASMMTEEALSSYSSCVRA